ncbi:hypothetical protein SCA6_004060 [Theobroma cacao]
MVGAMKEELVCYLVLTHKLFHQNIAQEVQMLWGTYLVKHGWRHFPDRCILSCSFFIRVNLWPSPIRDSSQGPTNSKSQVCSNCLIPQLAAQNQKFKPCRIVLGDKGPI